VLESFEGEGGAGEEVAELGDGCGCEAILGDVELVGRCGAEVPVWNDVAGIGREGEDIGG